jgi:environmental stress-induced protein Ves
MLKIISPKEFKTIPWKNGQGETTELAINDNGTLEQFDWRLSIASVIKEGAFSNFNGYYRNLVLIEGEGICLKHDDDKIDNLKKRLDIARFSGGCKTYGSLTNGAIKDFNIITNIKKISPIVHCYLEAQQVVINLSVNSICFAYSLSDEIVVETFEQESSLVPVGCLVKLSAKHNEQLTIGITGKNMIIVELELINA